MISWYYVEGTERIGPVSFEALRQLCVQEKINHETYVWKKGFANWERLKNVSELSSIFEIDENIKEEISEITNEHFNLELKTENQIDSIQKEEVSNKSSPIIIDSFNWENLNRNSSVFYLNIGRDRRQNKSHYFGPFSIKELIYAFKQKRINDNSLVFAAGLDNWQEVHSIPILRKSLELEGLTIPINVKSPYLFIGERVSTTFDFLVKDINLKQAEILTGSQFTIGEELQLSLFKGMNLKSRNITVRVDSINKFEQSYVLSIIEMNEDVVKAIHEFNE